MTETQFERTGNPFPGLRPFETDEYNLFFGREGQSDELLARLGRTRFLAVVGTSGSGKSSLIRAGLIPAIYGGLMPGAGSGWRIAVMRPGHDPVGNLARALSLDEVLGSRETDDDVEATIIETTLRRSTLGVVDAVRQARLPEYDSVLVVVDQFEELFRFRSMRANDPGTEDDAAAFVKLLIEAAHQREVPLYIVLTMRSDFLGDCSQFQGLPEAVNEGQYLIPRLTRDERRDAITGPAAVGGSEMSPPLVNRLLNDVGDNPDQLPILQHALMRTWEHWAARPAGGEPVGLEDYEAVGTMADALSRHADEAYNELPGERSRRLAELVFKALTERGGDNREIRRPTRLRELCEIAEASDEEIERVVEVFRREGRSFLMPPAGVRLDLDTVVDISHESLIRNWGRLKEWVRDEAEGARIYRRLAEAATAYKAGEGGLLDDVTLGWVLRWRDRYTPDRAWGVRYHPAYDDAIAFMEESRAAREAEAAERERQRREAVERERREREQAELHAAEAARHARRLRVLVAAMGVLFAVAAVAFVAALVLEKRAEAARRVAETTRQKLQMIRNAQANIQSYEMELAERQLNELYGITNDDDEGHENRAWVLYSLGELNLRLERHDRASAFFESALQTEMLIHDGRLGLEAVGTLDSLAHTLEGEGNYRAAIARYEQLASLVDSAAATKGRYYRLNAANVHVDLAEIYIKQADPDSGAGDAAQYVQQGGDAAPTDINSARAKAEPHYRAAAQIWDDVLRDDPEALSDNYIRASAFYADKLGDRKTADDFLSKAGQLRRKSGTPTARKPIGSPNPGGDSDILAQLPPEGAGYVLFSPDASYGREEFVGLLQKVASAWAARHPDHKIVVADMSLKGGGPFPSHGGDHQDGREADIWPITNNGDPEPTNIYAPNYSRELTVEFINLIRQTAPSAVVYFDDPPLVAAGLVRATLDHNNHMHVILP
ncbi:MAG TPA: penicillin-insensitive murein endopeptidase [Pyrinomonadaceae bacterium]|nr:penicillin-insensitive murein endopeptidase [Pyrinomonadaceae bacterium]